MTSRLHAVEFSAPQCSLICCSRSDRTCASAGVFRTKALLELGLCIFWQGQGRYDMYEIKVCNPEVVGNPSGLADQELIHRRVVDTRTLEKFSITCFFIVFQQPAAAETLIKD